MRHPVNAFRPFASIEHSKPFRWLLLGQAVALQGTWIQGTAQRWLILQLSNAPWVVGLLGAVSGLPILLFSLWGGMLSDRLPRISVLLAAQSLVLFQSVAFGFLVQTGVIKVPEILILAFLLGTGMAFEVPARQSLVFDFVGREHITNALGLHSTAFNLARFGGPALAGMLMGAGLLYACFYLKALSAVVIIAVLVMLSRRAGKGRGRLPAAERLTGMRAAIGYAWNHRMMRMVLLLILVFGVVLLPYSILLPSFGRDVLGLGPKEYGFLCAANGLGALAGAIFVSLFGHVGRRERWWWTGAVMFPLTILAFSVSRGYYQALCVLTVSGFFMVITSTSAISLLQLYAEDAFRGRIMGLFTTSFMGLFPVGSLAAGILAQFFGVRATLGAGAAAAFLSVPVVWWTVSRAKACSRSE